MNYIFGLIVVIVAYILWNTIRYIISILFPNFHKKHGEKLISHGRFSSGVNIKEKEYQNNENVHEDYKNLINKEKEKKENSPIVSILIVIIFFIMIFAIQNYYRENIRLKNHLANINQYKKNTHNYEKENIKLKRMIHDLKIKNYLKDYIEIKTKYEKLQEENKIMKIFIEKNKKETKFY